jgi:hypothetical protein
MDSLPLAKANGKHSRQEKGQCSPIAVLLPGFSKKQAKMVLFTRLRGVQKVREVRKNTKCRDVWGFKGNLLDVQTHPGTYSNPKSF